MTLRIPALSLVVLIGPSGSGKSTFARRHFGPFEVVSSDYCRGLVSNDENSLDANDATFALLYEILRLRLARGLLTVVDATNVTPESRRGFVKVASEFHVLPAAIAFNLPQRLCHERNESRTDRSIGGHAITNQHGAMRRSLRGLDKEGFRYTHVFRSAEDVDAATIERVPLWNDRRTEHGPFDIVGDVHGCREELGELLDKLGYAIAEDGALVPPPGRRLIMVGDLVDRGPDAPGVLRLIMRAVRDGVALCVPGNHDIKLMRALNGRKVQVAHGLQQSLDQLANESDAFRRDVAAFIDGLVSHYVLDDGKLVVAHAGLKESMQGRGSGAVREFCLYGETTGESDEFGLPIRLNWAEEYRGKARVVFGHTTVPEPQFLNNTVNIDTGCVFGGRLTAYRYPEGDLVSVSARREYAVPTRPLLPVADASLSVQQTHDGLLYAEDVFGKRSIETRLRGRINVRAENAGPAMEVMSRFGADPRWLIYLPPTMSPCETSQRAGVLEHPEDAFAYFADEGVVEVVVEEKHMGSRAVVVVCRDADVARTRFGITSEEIGCVYSRTGRPFFADAVLRDAFLAEVRNALTRAGAWEELDTDWVCLDCELMPWSAKARDLLVRQYAPVAAAGEATLSTSVAALERAVDRGVGELGGALSAERERADALHRYRAAYRRYCGPVDGLSGYRLAPFHILATQGATHVDKPHAWHMQTIHGIVERAASPLLVATPWRIVTLADDEQRTRAIEWWTDLTTRGGEGMVVKPASFIATGRRGVVQPAVKCRGAEYLRIIYGPEYTREANLSRLRGRGLSHKRSMALREFALGVESLERFVRREPLRRVHECVLGVLALETEPVDPRL